MIPFETSGPKALLLCIVISVALTASLVGNVYSLIKGRHVDFVWLGDDGSLHSRLGAVPEQYYVDIAKLVVGTLGNVTPHTIVEAVETVRPYLESDTYVRMRATAEGEARTMQDASLSIMTTGVHLQAIQASEQATRVQLRAIRTMFSGALPIEPHEITIVLDIRPPSVEQGRRTGRPVSIVNLMWPPLRVQNSQFQDFQFQLDRQENRRPGGRLTK